MSIVVAVFYIMLTSCHGHTFFKVMMMSCLYIPRGNDVMLVVALKFILRS